MNVDIRASSTADEARWSERAFRVHVCYSLRRERRLRRRHTSVSVLAASSIIAVHSSHLEEG